MPERQNLVSVAQRALREQPDFGKTVNDDTARSTAQRTVDLRAVGHTVKLVEHGLVEALAPNRLAAPLFESPLTLQLPYRHPLHISEDAFDGRQTSTVRSTRRCGRASSKHV